MVPTPDELQEAERTIERLHPEWWADPHYRLHRKYGWRATRERTRDGD